MASGFSFSLDDTRCEGCHSDDSAHVSYRVEVRQKLCDGCAHDKKDSINAAEWFCKKHVMDKAKIFCLTHDIPICEACAITTHSKSSCSLGDIDDILEDRKDYLVRLIEMSKTNEDTFTHQMSTVDEELAGIEQHFAKEEEKLRLAYDGEMKKLTKAFEDRQQTLKKASIRLQKTTENLRVQPEKKYKDLVTMRARAEELLTNKEDLMKEFQEFNSSVTCLTSKIQPDHNLKIVKQIVGVARKVTFTEADSQAIGKIEIPEETWVPNNEYNPEIGKLSYMMGAIGGTKVVIKDQDKHSIYVVNIEAKIKKKVIKSNNPHDLWRCVPLWKDGISRIVCGSNDGEIVICDRSWKVLTVIRVAESSSVAVAVNKDGLILATAIGSCTIGIYDPTDGKLVRSIQKKTPVYDVCALASGHIVVMNECVEGIDVSVLDDSGEALASKHCHGEGIKSLVVDRGHDLIYLLSWDRHHSDYKVCVLSTSAEVVAERVAVCEPSFYSPSCAIPRPDRMVIYTDGKILTFRKTKRGFHQLLAEIKLKESADLESSDNHE